MQVLGQRDAVLQMLAALDSFDRMFAVVGPRPPLAHDNP